MLAGAADRRTIVLIHRHEHAPRRGLNPVKGSIGPRAVRWLAVDWMKLGSPESALALRRGRVERAA